MFKRYEEIKKLRAILKPILWPVAGLYLVGFWMRKFLYRISVLKTYRIPCRVVGVGNLTLGGTGKTSLAIELAKELNTNLGIVNKGYGRKSKRTVLIKKDEKLDMEEIGDEPYMLSRALNVPICVSDDKYRACLFLLEKSRPNIIVIDDAFQYLKIKKDINILCLDATVPIWEERVFPLGNLRQPLTKLENVNLIALTKYNLTSVEVRAAWTEFLNRKFPNVKICRFLLIPLYFVSCYNDQIFSLESMRDKEATLLSAIGNPHSFLLLMESLGIKIKKQISFLDHYFLHPKDVISSLDLNPVITTEKDSDKLKRYKAYYPDFFERLFYIKVRCSPLDTEIWKEFIGSLEKT